MAALSNFWQRIITGSIFLLVMIGSIVWSFESFLLIFFLVSTIGMIEYGKMTRKFANPQIWLVIIIHILIILSAICFYYWLDQLFSFPKQKKYLLLSSNSGDRFHNVYLNTFGPFVIFIKNHLFIISMLLLPISGILFLVIGLITDRKHAIKNAIYSLLGIAYITIPFLLLMRIALIPKHYYNHLLILSYFILLWTTDSFAYVWGKLLGKHKLAPKISPGKTIEGTVGGILTTAALAASFAWLFPGLHLTVPQWIIMGLLIAMFAVPSDLSESVLKRKAGVKDSGNILPGHGGILDRFDSVLLTAPVVYLYLQILQMI